MNKLPFRDVKKKNFFAFNEHHVLAFPAFIASAHNGIAKYLLRFGLIVPPSCCKLEYAVLLAIDTLLPSTEIGELVTER